MDDEESVVETGTEKKRRDTARTLGQALGRALDPKAPAAKAAGREKSTPGAVGLRSVTQKIGNSDKARQRRQTTQKVLAETHDARRQAIWDKLDAAKRKADQKTSRLKAFEPEKTDPGDPGPDADLEDALEDDLDQDFEEEFDF